MGFGACWRWDDNLWTRLLPFGLVLCYIHIYFNSSLLPLSVYSTHSLSLCYLLHLSNKTRHNSGGTCICVWMETTWRQCPKYGVNAMTKSLAILYPGTTYAFITTTHLFPCVLFHSTNIPPPSGTQMDFCTPSSPVPPRHSRLTSTFS